jgi:predicted RNA polymerase sigma factor
LINQEQVLDYQPYWAARAHLLGRVGAMDEAQGAYERAIVLSRDNAVRRFCGSNSTEIVSRH